MLRPSKAAKRVSTARDAGPADVRAASIRNRVEHALARMIPAKGRA
jgi:hypothetical protein